MRLTNLLVKLKPQQRSTITHSIKTFSFRQNHSVNIGKWNINPRISNSFECRRQKTFKFRNIMFDVFTLIDSPEKASNLEWKHVSETYSNLSGVCDIDSSAHGTSTMDVYKSLILSSLTEFTRGWMELNMANHIEIINAARICRVSGERALHADDDMQTQLKLCYRV